MHRRVRSLASTCAFLLCLFLSLPGAASFSGIVDPGIPGRWHGTQGGWTVTLDLAMGGWFSGSVSGPDVANCTFSGQVSTASRNIQGKFDGTGTDVQFRGCFRDWQYSVRITATPASLAFEAWDPQDPGFDPTDLVDVGGMTRTASVGGSADAREAKAGMWNSPPGGWGLSLVTGKTPQRTPFVVLYVYGADKAPIWYVMPGGVWTDDSNFEGALYATNGTDWRSPKFDPGSFKVTKVGTLSMSFTSDSAGQLTYRINEGSTTYVSSAPMVKQQF
jgi:hypothetical protein